MIYTFGLQGFTCQNTELFNMTFGSWIRYTERPLCRTVFENHDLFVLAVSHCLPNVVTLSKLVRFLPHQIKKSHQHENCVSRGRTGMSPKNIPHGYLRLQRKTKIIVANGLASSTRHTFGLGSTKVVVLSNLCDRPKKVYQISFFRYLVS